MTTHEMDLKPDPKVLLKETYNYIMEHPWEHNQRTWGVKNSCGTAYCFAGHAVLLAGYKITFDSEGFANLVDTPHGKQRIEYLAKELLGLKDHEATRLFNASNSHTRIRSILESWDAL